MKQCPRLEQFPARPCHRSHQAAPEFPFGAIGGMVVQETARAAGIASLPTPISEEFDDQFFLYQGFFAGANSSAGTQIDGIRVYPFDSKAQRRVESGQAVVFTVENASAGAGLFYTWKFRMLIKLH